MQPRSRWYLRLSPDRRPFHTSCSERGASQPCSTARPPAGSDSAGPSSQREWWPAVISSRTVSLGARPQPSRRLRGCHPGGRLPCRHGRRGPGRLGVRRSGWWSSRPGCRRPGRTPRACRRAGRDRDRSPAGRAAGRVHATHSGGHLEAGRVKWATEPTDLPNRRVDHRIFLPTATGLACLRTSTLSPDQWPTENAQCANGRAGLNARRPHIDQSIE